MPTNARELVISAGFDHLKKNLFDTNPSINAILDGTRGKPNLAKSQNNDRENPSFVLFKIHTAIIIPAKDCEINVA
jgi:hypothetical protein